MIPGFEDFTEDVTKEEIEVINMIAKGLNAREGSKNAITNAQAREALYRNKGINVADAKFRKYIQYIRAYNLVPMLCASSKGYWVAKDEEEFQRYVDGYASRTRSMQFTLACMTHYGAVNSVINNPNNN